MGLDVHEVEGICIVRPNLSHVTQTTGAAEVHEALEVAVNDGKLAVAVDLKGVKFADSPTIDALIDTHKALMKNGGELCVFHVEPEVREFFQQTMFHRFIQICTDEQDAIFHFENSPKKKRRGLLRLFS